MRVKRILKDFNPGPRPDKTSPSQPDSTSIQNMLTAELEKTIQHNQEQIDCLEEKQTFLRQAKSDIYDSARAIQYRVKLTDTDSYRTGDAWPAVDALTDDLAAALKETLKKFHRNSGQKVQDIVNNALDIPATSGLKLEVQAIINGQVINIPVDYYRPIAENINE